MVLQHQRLAVADEDVHRAIAVGGGRDAHQLRQIRHQLIALIEQIIRRLAAAVCRAHDDLLVQSSRSDVPMRIDLLTSAVMRVLTSEFSACSCVLVD